MDGNQVCAIIGNMPEEKAVEFGFTVAEALYNLAMDIEEDKLELTLFDVNYVWLRVIFCSGKREGRRRSRSFCARRKSAKA